MSDAQTTPNAGAVPTPAPIELTRQAFARLTTELELLRTVTRPEVARRIQRAELFLTPEPAELAVRPARWDLAALDRKIADLEALLANAHVINETPSSTAKLGSTVTVRYDDGTEEALRLVSWLEADPSRGYVASESRVGKALLGKAPGEKVTVEADGTAMTLTIDRIGSPSDTGTVRP